LRQEYAQCLIVQVQFVVVNICDGGDEEALFSCVELPRGLLILHGGGCGMSLMRQCWGRISILSLRPRMFAVLVDDLFPFTKKEEK
jgi:hypothetical protein